MFTSVSCRTVRIDDPKWLLLYTFLGRCLLCSVPIFAATTPAPGNGTCAASEFACGDGQCIDAAWRCDGQKDCVTGADESNSCGSSCPPDQFSCLDGLRCIEAKWKCDQDMDCADGSDEAPSLCGLAPVPTVSTCSVDRFLCADRSHCLSRRWLCDGEKDCLDGSDELNCRPTTTSSSGSHCTAHEFACASGRCIPQILRCDSSNDCGGGDRSDETNCTCREGQFACTHTHQCVPSSMRCNGGVECLDGTDEAGCAPSTAALPVTVHTTPASHCNSKCEQECLTGDKCSCHDGYELHSNSVNCTDVDECASVHGSPCSQKCLNLPGSYLCSCVDGYVLSHDNRSCKANGERPHIVFANRIDIRQLRLGLPEEYTIVVGEGKSILALDIDESHGVVYYSDTHEEAILRADLPSAEGNYGVPEVLISEDVKTVDGIAYDWVYKKVYWTDAVTKSVSAVHVSAPQRRVILISESLSEPRAIALYPNKGLMFLSDWGQQVIYRAGMDGDNLLAIVKDNIMWPNGLTLDHTTELLYWIDAALKCIQISDLNGHNQRTLVSGREAVNNPFAISVFEDNVYWSERERTTIMTAHKLTGANVMSLLNDTMDHGEPMDIKIRHAARQPRGDDLCVGATCEHMCFPTPSWPGINVSKPVTCRCFVNYTLDANEVTCRPAARPEAGAQSGSGTQSAASEPMGAKEGVIAGATLAGLVFVVLFILGGVCVYRRFFNNGERTVNFDNPVYVKTTEDKLDLKYNEHQPSRTIPAVLQPLNSPEAQAPPDECEA